MGFSGKSNITTWSTCGTSSPRDAMSVHTRTDDPPSMSPSVPTLRNSRKFASRSDEFRSPW